MYSFQPEASNLTDLYKNGDIGSDNGHNEEANYFKLLIAERRLTLAELKHRCTVNRPMNVTVSTRAILKGCFAER
jgi:hypothetical protein